MIERKKAKRFFFTEYHRGQDKANILRHMKQQMTKEDFDWFYKKIMNIEKTADGEMEQKLVHTIGRKGEKLVKAGLSAANIPSLSWPEVSADSLPSWVRLG